MAGAQGGMKFTGNRVSAYSCGVEIALKMKAVRYEFVEDLNAPMPILLHNGKSIPDSGIILEYIEENWKLVNPLLPQDLYARAEARFISKFVQTELAPAIVNAFTSRGNEESMVRAYNLLKLLEKELEGKKFFGGASIGMADISAIFIGYWVGIIQQVTGIQLLTKASHPVLSDWCDNIVTNPFVKDILPSQQSLVSHYQNMFQQLGAAPTSLFSLLSNLVN